MIPKGIGSDFKGKEDRRMIYIIGGNGFVGSGIVRNCQKKGLAYAVVTRENCEALAKKPCHILINANGNSKKYMADRDPDWEFEASVTSVHRYLTIFSYDKYIQLSSCDVYPDCSDQFGTVEDAPLSPSRQSTYGFHKYMAEQCVMHFAKDWLIFRMGGFVGPGLKKNAIYDLLHGPQLWLSEDSRLQFISTDAAGDMILRLALSDLSHEILNLCGEGTVRIGDVKERVGSTVSVNPEAKTVLYEVNIDKLSALEAVQRTETAVFDFVDGMTKHTR